MRYVLAVLGLLVIIGALAAVKAKQIGSLIHFGKQAQKAGAPPESVGTSLAQRQSWEGTLSAVGSITAARGVSVSNDSPGVVSRILFESGMNAHEGQTLVELDTSVERAQLGSARSKLALAQLTAGRSRALLTSNSISKSQVDNDDAQLQGATTDVAALEAQIDRKTIKAPFSGRLGIRLVNLGQYLASGTPVTVLEASDVVYVDFTLPQQRLADIKIGMPVRVVIEGAPDAPHDGKISAIDPAVDSMTRTIKLRATVPNGDEKLRSGMFANVTVILPPQPSEVTIPATAVLHASYGDSVYVVENKTDDAGHVVDGPDGKPAKVARQQFVRTGDSRGDFVAVLDGVSDGQEVVSAGGFKLRNRSNVVVNNSVQTKPSLAPHPENH